jgi:hypothetical protein
MILSEMMLYEHWSAYFLHDRCPRAVNCHDLPSLCDREKIAIEAMLK